MLTLEKSAKLIVWQLIVVATLFLCLTSIPFSFFIKIFVNIFSPGRSNFKIIFFFSYVFMLLLLRYFKPIKISPAFSLLTMLMALLVFAIGVDEHFTFVYSFDNNFTNRLVAQDMGRVSCTHFEHIHASKIVLAWLAQWLPHLDLSQYDFGLPYLSFYPSWLLALHSVLYITCFIMTIYQLRSYDQFSLSVYTLFALTCFIVLRNQLDGGLLCRETLAALPIYCCIQWRLWRQPTPVTSLSGLWLPMLAMWSVTFGIAQYFYLQPHIGWQQDQPMGILFVVGFLVSIYAIFFALQQQKKLQATSIGLIFIVAALVMHNTGIFDNWGIRQFQYAIQKIEGRFTALVTPSVLARAMLNPNFSIENTNTIGNLIVMTASPKKPLYLWQLNKAWGLYINYAAIDVQTPENCNARLPYTTKGFIYVASSSLPYEPLRKTYKNIIFELKPDGKQMPYQRYAVALTLPGCTPDRIEIFKAILKDVGIQKSVMQLDDFIL